MLLRKRQKGIDQHVELQSHGAGQSAELIKLNLKIGPSVKSVS